MPWGITKHELAKAVLFLISFESIIRSDLNTGKSRLPKSRLLSPGDKMVQLGEHLINFNPVLQILGRPNMLPFVYHDPAHVGRPIFAG